MPFCWTRTNRNSEQILRKKKQKPHIIEQILHIIEQILRKSDQKPNISERKPNVNPTRS